MGIRSWQMLPGNRHIINGNLPWKVICTAHGSVEIKAAKHQTFSGCRYFRCADVLCLAVRLLRDLWQILKRWECLELSIANDPSRTKSTKPLLWAEPKNFQDFCFCCSNSASFFIPRMARSASRDLTQEGAMFQSSSSFLLTSITKEEFYRSTSSNPPAQGVDVHETRHSFDHRSFGWVYWLKTALRYILGIAEFQRVLWFSSRTIWEFWDYQNHLHLS